MSEGPQTLTYLVKVETYGHRDRVKASVGRRLARLLELNFDKGEVRFISKADVPKTKPYKVEELPQGVSED